MAFVLDASITLALGFPDEVSQLAENVLGQLRTTSAFVPPIWPLEVANAILIAQKRSRLTGLMVRRFIEDLENLPITVRSFEQLEAFHQVLELANQQDLTAYDASYLELARRERLPLATLDERLREAARRVGVAVLE